MHSEKRGSYEWHEGERRRRRREADRAYGAFRRSLFLSTLLGVMMILLYALPVRAEGRLELTYGATEHFAPGFNERHPALRYEHGGRDLYGLATLYHNSEGRLSAALGVGVRRGIFFAEGGLVSGYASSPLLPLVRAGIDLDRVRLFAFPVVTTDGAIHPGIGVEIVPLRVEF